MIQDSGVQLVSGVQACVRAACEWRADRRAGGQACVQADRRADRRAACERAKGLGRGARFFRAAQELIHVGQKNFSEFLTASYL